MLLKMLKSVNVIEVNTTYYRSVSSSYYSVLLYVPVLALSREEHSTQVYQYYGTTLYSMVL